jgi:hypothetical protein
MSENIQYFPLITISFVQPKQSRLSEIYLALKEMGLLTVTTGHSSRKFTSISGTQSNVDASLFMVGRDSRQYFLAPSVFFCALVRPPSSSLVVPQRAGLLVVALLLLQLSIVISPRRTRKMQKQIQMNTKKKVGPSRRGLA